METCPLIKFSDVFIIFVWIFQFSTVSDADFYIIITFFKYFLPEIKIDILLFLKKKKIGILYFAPINWLISYFILLILIINKNTRKGMDIKYIL